MHPSLLLCKRILRPCFVLLSCFCFLELLAVSSPAQNIVSRPVGFIRLNTDPGALMSSPFVALGLSGVRPTNNK